MAPVEQFAEGRFEGTEFRTGRRGGALIEHQPGIAAGQPQPGQMGEHLDLARARADFRAFPFGSFEFLDGALPQQLVERGLFRPQPDMQGDLGTFRQIVEHLRLEAAQHERRDQPSQPGAGLFVAVAARWESRNYAETFPRVPSRPGLMKLNSECRSIRLFWMGVPVVTRRKSAFSCRAAPARRVTGFLMA